MTYHKCGLPLLVATTFINKKKTNEAKRRSFNFCWPGLLFCLLGNLSFWFDVAAAGGSGDYGGDGVGDDEGGDDDEGGGDDDGVSDDDDSVADILNNVSKAFVIDTENQWFPRKSLGFQYQIWPE